MNLIFYKIASLIDPGGVNIPNKNADEGFVSGTFQDVLVIVFGVIGAISVLIITVAAFQYVTSGGDPQKTAKAKSTILYAVIGVVVSLLAISIVKFVLDGIFR